MDILILIAFLFIIVLAAIFSSSPLNRGQLGEQRIRERLNRFERKAEGKILSNLYIPMKSGDATEIDLLLIHQKGLFVLESKNYSGWIFGNEANHYWTQTLPKGWKGDVHKERFYNPIRQNATHISHLRPFITKNIPVWSIIVFSDECTLKDITVRSSNVHVIHCRHVVSLVSHICAQTEQNYLTETEVVELYNQLLPYTLVSDEEKQHHAQRVLEIKQRNENR